MIHWYAYIIIIIACCQSLFRQSGAMQSHASNVHCIEVIFTQCNPQCSYWLFFAHNLQQYLKDKCLNKEYTWLSVAKIETGMTPNQLRFQAAGFFPIESCTPLVSVTFAAIYFIIYVYIHNRIKKFSTIYTYTERSYINDHTAWLQLSQSTITLKSLLTIWYLR